MSECFPVKFSTLQTFQIVIAQKMLVCSLYVCASQLYKLFPRLGQHLSHGSNGGLGQSQLYLKTTSGNVTSDIQSDWTGCRQPLEQITLSTHSANSPGIVTLKSLVMVPSGRSRRHQHAFPHFPPPVCLYTLELQGS